MLIIFQNWGRREEHVALNICNIYVLELLLACLFKSLTLHILKAVKPCVVSLPFLASIIMATVQAPTVSNLTRHCILKIFSNV